MRGHHHRTTRRRGFAATAILLWLLGVEVLPNLHLAGHDDDHTHTPAGTIVVVTFDDAAPHRHADGSVHAHAPETSDAGDAGDADHDVPAPRRGDQLAIDTPAHAAAGIAHRALALLQAPPPATAPVEVPRVTWWIDAAPAAAPQSLFVARASARGPPVS
jgi:hypothetical protein